ncbi:MAG: TIGR00266 family protein [Fusobacteriota bacterium]
MRSHEIDYEILGDDIQTVEVELDPRETVIAEAGAMNWMDDGISFEAKMGDGSETKTGFMNKVFGAGKRLLTGESLFITHFTNIGSGKKKIAFSAPYPGKIVPLDMSKLPLNRFVCQKDAFLCAAMGTKVDITFNKKLGAGFFGGEGFILQKLEGDGRAFIHAGGTIVKKELKGETLKVDTGCLVGFTEGIDYDIQKAGNLKSMVFGGEGLFLATLRGTGTVYLQSLPFSRLANRIIKSAPRMGGNRKGEGSVLGAFGNMIDGDGF